MRSGRYEIELTTDEIDADQGIGDREPCAGTAMSSVLTPRVRTGERWHLLLAAIAPQYH